MDRKVSVIITVWNGENYLKEAIESALDQDYAEKEVIVVNDGSTDRSAEIIAQFGSKIRSITQENRGLGAARNTGVRISTGTYLAFLDHDDLWPKTKLSSQMKWIASSEEDPLVFSQVKQFICPSLTEDERKKIIVNEEIVPGYFAGTLLLSKRRFEEVGYFIEEKVLGEFVDWYLKAKEKQIPFLMMDGVTLYRRVHTCNMGRQKERYSRTDYLRILKASLDRRR